VRGLHKLRAMILDQIRVLAAALLLIGVVVGCSGSSGGSDDHGLLIEIFRESARDDPVFAIGETEIDTWDRFETEDTTFAVLGIDDAAMMKDLLDFVRNNRDRVVFAITLDGEMVWGTVRTPGSAAGYDGALLTVGGIGLQDGVPRNTADWSVLNLWSDGVMVAGVDLIEAAERIWIDRG